MDTKQVLSLGMPVSQDEGWVSSPYSPRVRAVSPAR